MKYGLNLFYFSVFWKMKVGWLTNITKIYGIFCGISQKLFYKISEILWRNTWQETQVEMFLKDEIWTLMLQCLKVCRQFLFPIPQVNHYNVCILACVIIYQIHWFIAEIALNLNTQSTHTELNIVHCQPLTAIINYEVYVWLPYSQNKGVI